MRLAEEGDQGIHYRLADALDVVELPVGLAVAPALGRRRRGSAKRFEGAERLGEIARGRLADVPDAQRVDETVEADLAPRLDGLE